MSAGLILSVVLVVACAGSAQAEFSQSFQDFISDRYGERTLYQLNRPDLVNGSFGGGNHVAGQKTDRIPVIFVHGMGATAADYLAVRDYFMTNGNYTDEELYATTYGPTESGEMRSDYVKTVRKLIVAVRNFTNGYVNIVAYSSGSAMAKNALYGGSLVDTREFTGYLLQAVVVDTLVSVAGVNWGLPSCECLYANCSLCTPSVGVCAQSAPSFGLTCNPTNGLKCNSQAMLRLNRDAVIYHMAFEAKFVFSILSTDDEVIGYNTCDDRINGMYPNSKGNITLSGVNHYDTMHTTYAQQLSYVLNHSA